MKLKNLCKSKIHHAVLTAADLNYISSIGIDKTLLDLVEIVPGEQVAVRNVSNGQRIETYAIACRGDSGQVVVNGAGADFFKPGDKVIIVAYSLTDELIRQG